MNEWKASIACECAVCKQMLNESFCRVLLKDIADEPGARNAAKVNQAQAH